jgi:tetratricopeptide (TPR) repeat protein
LQFPGPCAKSKPLHEREQCLPPPVAVTLPPIERSKKHMDRAVFLFWIHQKDQAIEEIRAAVKADPKSADAYHFAARISSNAYMAPGKSVLPGETLESLLEKAHNLAPDDSNIMQSMAYYKNMFGRKDEALEIFNRIEAKSSDKGRLHYDRAMVHRDNNRYDLALKDLDKAVEYAPAVAMYRDLRSSILLAQGRKEDAIEDLNFIIKNDRPRMESYMMRSVIYFQLGNYEKALQDVDTIIYGVQVKGTDVPMHFAISGEQAARMRMLRATLLFYAGRSAEAQQEFEVSLKNADKRAVLQLQLFLRRQGYKSVEITGKNSPEMFEAIKACIGQEDCKAGLALGMGRKA